MIFMYALWFLFLICTPVYLFSSGGFQMAHVPLLILTLAIIFRNRLFFFNNVPTKAFLGFTSYAVLINFLFFLNSGTEDTSFLIHCLYLLFNIMTLGVSFRMGSTPKGMNVTYWALLFIGVVQVGAFAVIGMNYGSVRYMAFFNNPNQLAAWGCMALVLVACMKKVAVVSVLKFLMMAGVCILLVLLTGSRAGTLTIACVLLIVFWRVPLWIKISIGLFAVLAFSWVIPFIEDTTFFSRTTALSEENVGDDRLWSRVWEYPLYNFLGAGEGGLDRFDVPNEIHSTFLAVLFCYGIPGLLLFFRFLKICTYRSLSNNFLLHVSPIFIIAMGHHMIRMTTFYVMLGTVAALLEVKFRKKEAFS